jgi:hypothetical protein
MRDAKCKMCPALNVPNCGSDYTHVKKKEKDVRIRESITNQENKTRGGNLRKAIATES